ncbi:tetratricopeptide repeat protein [Pseudomonas sp. GCM10022186]|uniref:tetratricopeptide repeat protein n=1 Tax=Pseudomonas sp. GCM10022186 TaxID=3252650 RepID=UPI003615CDE6
MKRLLMLFALGLLGGCASAPVQVGWLVQGGCGQPSQDQELALNLANDMVAEGRLHAALAHLQALPANLPEVRLRQARIYRSLDRTEAGPLYRSLLGTCLTAEGHHGLGQLAAARGDQPEALAQLREALRLAPTDAKVRNDLGLVFLREGRTEDARFEFLTALELGQGDALPALNLLSLLFYEERYQQAADLVSRLRLPADAVRQAEGRAREMKRQGPGAPLATRQPEVDGPLLAGVRKAGPGTGEEVGQ